MSRKHKSVDRMRESTNVTWHPTNDWGGFSTAQAPAPTTNAHGKTFASDLPMLQKKRTDLHPIATRFALPMPKLMISYSTHEIVRLQKLCRYLTRLCNLPQIMRDFQLQQNVKPLMRNCSRSANKKRSMALIRISLDSWMIVSGPGLCSIWK